MASEFHAVAAYTGAITSLLNLLVLLGLAFKTGRFVGEIESAVKALATMPNQVSRLEKEVAILKEKAHGNIS